MPTRRRPLGVFVLLIALLSWLVLPVLSAQAAPAKTSAFSTGTVFHADLLRTPDTRLVDAEVAFSGAAFDSSGIAADLLNEMGRRFVPKAADKTTFGRATGFEFGLGVTPADENQMILAGTAEQSAPPRLGLVTKEIGPADLSPLAWASLLRSEAAANTSQNACALGTDASRGRSYVTAVQLLDAGADDATDELDQPLVTLDAADPARAVSQSRSGTVLVAQRDMSGKLIGNKFGLMSEVRQTIAPVTLFKGTENEFTLELLGEWVLQVIATGLNGNAFVHYGPEKASPETSIARVVRPDGVENIFTMQQIFGPSGLVIPIPGVAEIVIGEPARAIGGAAGSKPVASPDGTMAAAAVDVVRVRALPDNEQVQLADVRLGHMEAKAQVPAGGISCAIPVQKTPSKDSVTVGDTFGMDFKITNPYDCTLRNVRLDDIISTEDGAKFEVLSTRPAAQAPLTGTLGSGDLKWGGLGDIKPGKSMTVFAEFAARGGAGKILDTANAFAELADCAEEGSTVAGIDVGVVGTDVTGVSTLVQNPVEIGVLSASGENLPKTGAPIVGTVLMGLALFGLGGGGMVLNRRLR